MTREKNFFSPILRTYNHDISKRWRVEYWEPTHNGANAKRVVVYGKINKTSIVEERIAIAELIIEKILKESKKSSVKSETRVKTFFNQIIEIQEIYWRKKTISAYNTVVISFEDFFKNKSLDITKLNPIEINKYFLALHKKGYSTNTIHKYKTILNRLFCIAIKYGINVKNPIVNVEKLKRSPQSLSYFSDQQIELIRTNCKNSQLWLGIQLLYYCFIRPGEQRLLKIGDINFDFGYIEIRGEISKNKKTQKVAIPRVLIAHLNYLKKYPNSYYVLGKEGHPSLTPITVNWLNTHHSKLLDELRIRGNYAFYSWKHTGAVKAAMSGINLKELQMQLRHHSLDMVNEYLKNLGVMQSENIIERFPSI